MQPQVSVKQLITEFVRSYIRLIAIVVVITLFNNFLNVLLPLSIGSFYDVVLQDHSTKGQMLHWLPFPIHTPRDFFIFFTVLVALKVCLTYWEKYLTSLTAEHFVRNLRERTFAAQLRQTWVTFRRKPVSKYLLRYSGDLGAVQRFVDKGLLGFSGDAFFLFSTFIVLYRMQPLLATAVLTLFALTVGAYAVLSRRLGLANAARRDQRAVNLDFVSARLLAFHTVKSFNRETREANRFRRHSAAMFEKNRRYFRLASLLQALNPFFFFATMALVLFLVAEWLVAEGAGIGRSEVLVFVLLLLYMRGVMRRVLEVNVVWQSGLLSLGKLVKMLNQPAEPQPSKAISETGEDAEDSRLTRAGGVGLRWENVAFAYEPGKPVLAGFSGECHPHTINLLRGSGKSSWFKLLHKLYEPENGQIWIDGLDYARLTPFEVRKRAALVSDEAPLLGKTVFKAIVFRPDPAKREKALRVLKRLRLHFGEAAEDTLDFPLDENGRNLAAGEVALLQMARALLSGKPLLLLDEPFRHLDGAGRRRLARLLNQLKTKHTIILAAEAPPRQLEIDQIIYLQPESVQADLDNAEIQHEE